MCVKLCILLVCCARRIASGCDDVAVQLQDMHQLTKDLVDEMKELIEAVSAFSGLAATYGDADLKILVTTHEYRHVIHLTRLMSETVKQWRALAQTVAQYAHRPSPRIPQARDLLAAGVLCVLFTLCHVGILTGSCHSPLAPLQNHGGGNASMQSGAHFQQTI